VTGEQDAQQNNKTSLRLKKNASGDSNHRRVKEKHRNLKQIFILSLDSLRERKVRSVLTILMVVVGGALMVAINAISVGSAAFMNKQIGSLAPNVIFVNTGSKSKAFQEAPGLATRTPRLTFDNGVVSRIKSLPFVKDVVPEYQAQVQLHVAATNIPGDTIGCKEIVV
jgi:ABC-type lipoprotein release transport system permease subunit